MFKQSTILTLVPILLAIMASASFAKDFIIYSISQDVPMGYKNEVIKKNYYVNMGTNQGVRNGTMLNAYRVISNSNPFDRNTRYNHQVPIGILEVIHSDKDASITKLVSINNKIDDPQFDIYDLIIGDEVNVQINN